MMANSSMACASRRGQRAHGRLPGPSSWGWGSLLTLGSGTKIAPPSDGEGGGDVTATNPHIVHHTKNLQATASIHAEALFAHPAQPRLPARPRSPAPPPPPTITPYSPHSPPPNIVLP